VPDVSDVSDVSDEEKGQNPITWADWQAAIDEMEPTSLRITNQKTFTKQKSKITDRFKSLFDSMKTMPPETELHGNPNYFTTDLMDHQKYAISWMLWREQQKPRGGILADDMVNSFIFNLPTNRSQGRS
jgi:transcription termination factor 2